MSARHSDLFNAIASVRALRRATRKALLSKRRKLGAAAFAANLEHELLRLERELLEGADRPGHFVKIELHDPNRERARPLQAANLTIETLRHPLRLAFVLKALDERRCEHAARSLDDIGRLIGAWRKSSAAYDSQAGES